MISKKWKNLVAVGKIIAILEETSYTSEKNGKEYINVPVVIEDISWDSKYPSSISVSLWWDATWEISHFEVWSLVEIGINLNSRYKEETNKAWTNIRGWFINEYKETAKEEELFDDVPFS